MALPVTLQLPVGHLSLRLNPTKLHGLKMHCFAKLFEHHAPAACLVQRPAGQWHSVHQSKQVQPQQHHLAAGFHDDMLCSCRICAEISIDGKEVIRGKAQAAQVEQHAKHVVASLCKLALLTKPT